MEFTPKISNSLEGLEKRKGRLLKLGEKMMGADNGNMYPVDLLALGAIKRTISTIAGFKLLVQSSNMVCARTMLRVQIDTALRFFSVFIVEDCHSYSMEIFGGKQINQLKDSSGHKMSDRYLINKLSRDYPWLPKVYKIISGYIHFSSSHFSHPVQHIDDKSRSIKFLISEEDNNYPEFSWVEIIDCFNESIDIFIKYLTGWIITKDNPELVKMRKDKHGDQ